MSQIKLSTASGITTDEYLQKKGFVSNFWKHMFVKCDEIKASDIYIQQFKNKISVRAKVNGQCLTVEEKSFSSSDIQKSMIDFFKSMCGLDLSTNESPQDRAFELELTKSRYRLALAPTPLGEYIVLRIIRDDFMPRLNDCNLRLEAEKDLRWALLQGQGLIIITGPTGSGKSSTLQACLSEVDKVKLSVLTIENPVERQIPGSAQMEITSSFGWNDAIKQAMRMAPDIILIGEIRDKESASLALEAAQTGHLVLTTLHTNDAAGVVDRLIGLGIDRHIIADNLLFLSAQRLLKKLCPDCRIKEGAYYRVGKGCHSCGQQGIIGRMPILEYGLRPDPSSIFNFNKEYFTKNQLKTTLLGEARYFASEGLIAKDELVKLGEVY